MSTYAEMNLEELEALADDHDAHHRRSQAWHAYEELHKRQAIRDAYLDLAEQLDAEGLILCDGNNPVWIARWGREQVDPLYWPAPPPTREA